MKWKSRRARAGSHLGTSLICGVALVLLGGAPPPGPGWAQNLGMSDLEHEIDARIDDSLSQHKMSQAKAQDLRARVEVLKADEQARRDRRDFPLAEYTRVQTALIAIASEIPNIPPLHPPEAAPANADWIQPDAPEKLDLTGYRLTFQDEFDHMDISPDGGQGRWFSPVHASFGEASFVPPGPGGPFRLERSGLLQPINVLDIAAKKTAAGWRSGLIQSVDSRGRGFSQQYGYFEMRARMPRGKATWPAFWLLTRNGLTDQTVTRGEIDVLEQYGSEPDRVHSSVHLWPAGARNAGGLASHWYKSVKIWTPGLSLGFHRYGVMLTPDWVTTYYDGVELARFPMQAQYKTPMYLLVDLAMHPKHIDQATNPSVLQVDYVRAYAKS